VVHDVTQFPPDAQLSVKDAETVGYAFATLADIQSDWTASLPEKAQRALLGSDDTPQVAVKVDDNTITMNSTGCLAQARSKVYGSMENYLAVAFATLTPQALGVEAIGGDPRVIEATQNWSTCMSKRGFSFSGPDQSQRAGEEIGGTSERSIAVADATCRVEADLQATYAAAGDDAVAVWLASHESVIRPRYAIYLTATAS
jgi:hypothetical protein